MSFNLKNWAINHEISAGELGSCSDWKTNPKITIGIGPTIHPTRGDYIEDSWWTAGKYEGRPNDTENRRLDYYVCGNSKLLGVIEGYENSNNKDINLKKLNKVLEKELNLLSIDDIKKRASVSIIILFFIFLFFK